MPYKSEPMSINLKEAYLAISKLTNSELKAAEILIARELALSEQCIADGLEERI